MSARDDWSVREEGGLFEFMADLVREQTAHLTGGASTAVLELAPTPDCPRCGGTLISEVSDPLSARCTACAEPLRRIT